MSYFNENMTSSEARTILFSVDGKTKEEMERIKQEYSEIAPRIIDREFRENAGCLTSEKL